MKIKAAYQESDKPLLFFKQLNGYLIPGLRFNESHHQFVLKKFIIMFYTAK